MPVTRHANADINLDYHYRLLYSHPPAVEILALILSDRACLSPLPIIEDEERGTDEEADALHRAREAYPEAVGFDGETGLAVNGEGVCGGVGWVCGLVIERGGGLCEWMAR